MANYSYHAFGISINSDIELAMLGTAKQTLKFEPALTIKQSNVCEHGIESAVESALHYQSKPGMLWLNVPNIARFLVLNGSEIQYQAYPNADLDALALQLSSSCMSAALHQSGMTVLHASAVLIKGKCIVFAAPSCEGKSLLAAALYKKGYTVISDELCAIDQAGLLQPGYPNLKIWVDCFNVLEIKKGDLAPIRSNLQKYYYPVMDNFETQTQAVDAIYLLHSHNKDEPLLEAAKGMSKLMPLRSQVHRLQYLEGLGVMPAVSKTLMKLANKTPLTHLTRPQKLKVAMWIELIENDIQTNLIKACN